MSEEVTFCPFCGSLIARRYRFCPFCGKVPASGREAAESLSGLTLAEAAEQAVEKAHDKVCERRYRKLEEMEESLSHLENEIDSFLAAAEKKE